MSIRLIASDLDGTLLTDCKELSPKTREVLDLAVQHGIYIVPATGRSFHSIPEMIRNYPGVEYVITANGGAVYSVREGKRVYQCLLEKESVEAYWGGTTHPEVVAGIVEYLQEKGFSKLVIMEGSWVGDKTSESYEVCGFKSLCEKYNVPFLDMQKEKGVPVQCGDMTLNICKSVLDLDFLINVPVLKGHCQTKITCALKNMKGLLPNSEKRRFHALGLHDPIAHLGLAIHQDFIVVDNICGDLDFEDGGNPVEMNRVLAAVDPVLMDAYVCDMMYYQVEEVPYIVKAAALGVGCADIRQAEIRALDGNPGAPIPKSRKVVELADAVEEVESCSACYGNLIPALDRLKQEGLLSNLTTRISIGQGYRNQKGTLGIGHCTRHFTHHLEGCPPTEDEIYEFLKIYLIG